MKTCLNCGCGLDDKRNKFCNAARCQDAKILHSKKYMIRWRKENRERQRKYYSQRRGNKRSLPRVTQVFKTYDRMKGLEQASRPIMERILDAWLDMFSDRDQVELVFLECQHLRGHRDPVMATISQECGGSMWGGIFPNRGGRL